MGFHKTKWIAPIWGDSPSEILLQAFEDIDNCFKNEIGRKMQDADLIIGCHHVMNQFLHERRVNKKNN